MLEIKAKAIILLNFSAETNNYENPEQSFRKVISIHHYRTVYTCIYKKEMSLQLAGMKSAFPNFFVQYANRSFRMRQYGNGQSFLSFNYVSFSDYDTIVLKWRIYFWFYRPLACDVTIKVFILFLCNSSKAKVKYRRRPQWTFTTIRWDQIYCWILWEEVSTVFF